MLRVLTVRKHFNIICLPLFTVHSRKCSKEDINCLPLHISAVKIYLMLLCNLWLCPGWEVAAVGGAAADVHPDGRRSQEGEDRGGGQEEEVQELQVRTAV